MKAIQIRNVPDEVHAVLQRRADAAGQSMQEYLLAMLRGHAERPTVREVMDAAASDARSAATLMEVAGWVREERAGR